MCVTEIGARPGCLLPHTPFKHEEDEQSLEYHSGYVPTWACKNNAKLLRLQLLLCTVAGKLLPSFYQATCRHARARILYFQCGRESGITKELLLLPLPGRKDNGVRWVSCTPERSQTAWIGLESRAKWRFRWRWSPIVRVVRIPEYPE